MAQSVAVKYNRSSTYGSLAYDIPGVKTMPEAMPGYVPQEYTKTDANQKSGVRVKNRELAKPAISPVTVIGILIAAMLALMIVMSYVQLNAISVQSAEYVNQIEELKEEETQLDLKYESAFDFREIEDYAVNELGMVKASSGNKIYLNETSEDKAVVIESDANNSGVWSVITNFFDSLKEYFS